MTIEQEVLSICEELKAIGRDMICSFLDPTESLEDKAELIRSNGYFLRSVGENLIMTSNEILKGLNDESK